MTSQIATVPNVNSDHALGFDWLPGLQIFLTGPSDGNNALYQYSPLGSEGGGSLGIGFSDLRTEEFLTHCTGSSHKTSGLTFDASAYGLDSGYVIEQFISSVWEHSRHVGDDQFFCDYDSRYHTVGGGATNNGQASVLGLGNYCQTQIGLFGLNDTTGDQSVTGVGFQPDAVIFVGCVAQGRTEGLCFMLGAVDSDLNQWACCNRSRVAHPADWERKSVIHDDACIVHIGSSEFLGPPTVDQLASIVSLDSDGFTINLSAAGHSGDGDVMIVGYVAIKVLSGDGIKVGTFEQGDASITAGFQPDTVLFATGQSPVFGTVYQWGTTNGGFYDVGFVCEDGTSPDQQSSYWVGTSQCYTDTGAAIRMIDDTTLVGRATAAISATGVDLTWPTDGGQNYKGGFIAFQIDANDLQLDATTLDPTITSPTTATLHGTITPNTLPGEDVSYYFEWGLTTGYGNVTPTLVAGDGFSPILVSANITGLTNGQTYHYRLVAINQFDCPMPQNDVEFVQREPVVRVRQWGWRTEIDDDGNEASTLFVSPEIVSDL